MLLAMLPLLLPSGIIVTVCSDSGALGLRGTSEVVCACGVPPEGGMPSSCCSCVESVEAVSTMSGPCCIDVAIVGEDPVDSARVESLALPNVESASIVSTPAPALRPTPILPMFDDVALTRRRQPLLI